MISNDIFSIMVTPRYFILALCSGAIGAIASLIFWVIYFMQSFDAPISQTVRIQSALIGTVAIILIPIVLMYRKSIMEYLAQLAEDEV